MHGGSGSMGGAGLSGMSRGSAMGDGRSEFRAPPSKMMRVDDYGLT